jgi:hypothetical protein
LEQLEKREEDFFRDMQSSSSAQKSELIQLNHFKDLNQQRQGDINSLVSQINDLAVLFKELSILVIE